MGGTHVDGWGFGVTDVERRPKPALDVLARWARSGIEDLRARWPRVSVVVCAYNVEDWIEQAIESVLTQTCGTELLEVILLDSGSITNDEFQEIKRRAIASA